MTDAIPSDEKREKNGRFIVPPKSPGRPKGSRNKLGEAFLADMLEDWSNHGPAVIAEVRAEKPDQYLKVVASILPKELNLRVGEFDDMTDDELARELASISQQLVALGSGDSEGIVDPADAPASAGTPAKLH